MLAPPIAPAASALASASQVALGRGETSERQRAEAGGRGGGGRDHEDRGNAWVAAHQVFVLTARSGRRTRTRASTAT